MPSCAFVSAIILVLVGETFAFGSVPVINFQTDAGGSTSAADNTASFYKAVALSESSGLSVFVPPGVYPFTQSINSTGVCFFGVSPVKSIFKWTTQLGVGRAAWEVFGSHVFIRDLGMITSFGRPELGTFKANFHGIRLNHDIHLVNVEVQGFYGGIVWNSDAGHTTQESCHSSNNYYGIYVQASNGDNFFTLGGIEGNTMASIGIPATTALGAGDFFFRTHMCFGPYGVYQEGPAPENTGYVTMMADAHFQLARFESCGNGAIFTENAGTKAYGGISEVELYNVGFSWNPNYRINSRAHDYAVVVGTTQRTSYYYGGISGFSAGKLGIWNLTQANSWGGVQSYESAPISIPGKILEFDREPMLFGRPVKK